MNFKEFFSDENEAKIKGQLDSYKLKLFVLLGFLKGILISFAISMAIYYLIITGFFYSLENYGFEKTVLIAFASVMVIAIRKK